MAQDRRNQNQQQGNQQRGGNQPRRVISLTPIAEETVDGAKRVLLQARVQNGRRPFSGEPLTLTTNRPIGANNQFGGFIEEATQLAHWPVTVPSGQEHTFQVADRDGNISLPVTVSAKTPAVPPDWNPTVVRKPDGTASFSAQLVDGKGNPLKEHPLRIVDGATSSTPPEKTDEMGRIFYEAKAGTHLREVVVSVPGTGLEYRFYVGAL